MSTFGLNRRYRKGEYVKCINNDEADQWTRFLTRGKVVKDDGRTIRVRVLSRSQNAIDINTEWWMQRRFLRPLHDNCDCSIDTSMFE